MRFVDLRSVTYNSNNEFFLIIIRRLSPWLINETKFS